jgi:isopentenyldiphosphate isomerase
MAQSPADELVDITDATGTVIGTATRREMRARNLPHRCTYVLVFNRRGDLFVHQRTATKDVNPSFWDVAAGGVVAAGESFDDSARRELREELGVDATPEPLFPFRYADGRTVAHAMAYRVTHDGPFVFQPEEVARGEFVPVADLERWFAEREFCRDGVEVWRQFVRRGLAR